MKVAIMGAPGSGKSELAAKLATSMGREGFKRPVIIDGYVESLQEKTGYQLDVGATFPQNYQIIFHRWTLEQEAEHKGRDTITCGTMYETFIYCVLHSNLMEEANPRDMENVITTRSAMTALGMIESLIFDYDVLLYLPYTREKLTESGHSYDTVVDVKLPETLEAYRKEFVTLDGTEKENVKYANRLVKAIRGELQSSLAEQQAVRGSGGDDQEESKEE